MGSGTFGDTAEKEVLKGFNAENLGSFAKLNYNERTRYNFASQNRRAFDSEKNS